MAGAPVGRNIPVVGSPGSGKSTLARQLGVRLALRVVHLDRLYWSQGWRVRPAGERDALIAAAIAGDGWIFDGNHFGSLDVRAERADTLVILDLPRGLCMRRLLTRIALGHGRVRPDMADGCPERFDGAFLRWVWRFPRHSRPILERFHDGFPGRRYRLRHPRQVRDFLHGVRIDLREGA